MIAKSIDLNDDLSDLIGSPTTVPKVPPANYQPVEQRITEPCSKCGGSGRWRPGYPCFKCKGTGKLTFKTDRVTRDRARAKSAEKRTEKRVAEAERRREWIEAHRDVCDWITANAGHRNDFALSLDNQLAERGSLSDNQIAAVRRSIEKSKERAAERKASAPTVDATALEAAFAKAAPKLKRPKLWIADMGFSYAKPDSPNAGALYVKRGATYLGKIMGGKFMRSRDCDDATQQAVLDVVADPRGAAIRHGRLTGSCAICNRSLTDATSVANGIGPVCAGKFGW